MGVEILSPSSVVPSTTISVLSSYASFLSFIHPIFILPFWLLFFFHNNENNLNLSVKPYQNSEQPATS
jgi:hypothetical protein